MQKIVPHLWFDKEAKEAAAFYTSLFPKSRITSTQTLHNTPSGDCDVVGFELQGYSFMAISAGPYFKPNPSISFMVNFDPAQDTSARMRIDEVYSKLSDGGMTLMPLDKYPFSERYAWVQDRYGFSWQLIFTDPKGELRPPIMPFFMFVGENAGKAEEATSSYISLFKNSKRGKIMRHTGAPEKEGTILFTDFMLENQWFVAMDSALEHKFAFNEAVSLMVKCDSQEEIDYYWKLSAVPEAEQCGWVKDMYGVSWQVTSSELDRMMTEGTEEQRDRVTQSFLKMKKFDVAELKRAYEGK